MLSSVATFLLFVATALLRVDAQSTVFGAGIIWSDPPLPGELVPARKPPEVGVPVRVVIPSVGVDAKIERVGLAADGSVGVPQNPDNVAWFQLGARPGEDGNAIITGHVDWAGKIRNFWYLRNLSPGDIIETVAEDGRTYRFSVRWVRLYRAQDAPLDEIYGDPGGSAITLITCGGVFDRATHQYLSRWVVRAALQPGS